MSDNNVDQSERDGDPTTLRRHDVEEPNGAGASNSISPVPVHNGAKKAGNLFLREKMRSTAQNTLSNLKERLHINNNDNDDQGMMETRNFFQVPKMPGLRNRSLSDSTDYINEQRSGDNIPESSGRASTFRSFRLSFQNNISRLRMDKPIDQMREENIGASSSLSQANGEADTVVHQSVTPRYSFPSFNGQDTDRDGVCQDGHASPLQVSRVPLYNKSISLPITVFDGSRDDDHHVHTSKTTRQGRHRRTRSEPVEFRIQSIFPNKMPQENWRQTMKRSLSITQMVKTQEHSNSFNITVLQAAPLVQVNEQGEKIPVPIIDFDAEVKIITRAAKEAEQAGYDPMTMIFDVGTRHSLMQYFSRGASEVLQISCHGNPDYLAFGDGYGRMMPLRTDELRHLLALGLRTLGSTSACPKVQLVVLLGESTAGKISQAFIDSGINHVIACRHSDKEERLSEPAMLEFCMYFYRALGQQVTILKAFDLAKESIRWQYPIESELLVLLPQRLDAGNRTHDIPITCESPRQSMARLPQIQRPTMLLPRTSSNFNVDEKIMYEIVDSLANVDLVRVEDEPGAYRTKVVSKACEYVWKRKHIFHIDDIFWLPPLSLDAKRGSPLVDDLISFMDILLVGDEEYLQTNTNLTQNILDGLKDKRALLVVDAAKFKKEASIRLLSCFFDDLICDTDSKVIFVCSARKFCDWHSDCRVESCVRLSATANQNRLMQEKPNGTAGTICGVKASGDSVDEKVSVFVSYSRRDWDPFVSSLVDRLRDNHFEVWVDQHLLVGGDDWMDSINDALNKCQALVLVISPEALASKFVKMEYRYFFNSGKPLIPILYRPVSPVPAEISILQQVDFNNTQQHSIDKSFEELFRVLNEKTIMNRVT